MDYNKQIEEVNAYVTAYFKENADSNLLYHNYDHTVTVVRRVKEIAANYPLSSDDNFVLTAAAWFHDTGQLLSNGEDHEEISASIMEAFFQENSVEMKIVQAIRQCILSTKIPHHPKTFLDKVICDADTYNLGTDEFPHTDALLKREFELRGLPTGTWEEDTLKLLQQHRYFTTYCQQLLQKGKAANMELVRRRSLP